ncbi:UDP-N-acetyl glucosamine 2-epimerase [Vibrio nigripulchritudo]|uniref:UDP-N-acetylglucosamine 2-epimerase n=1 Tax=Vibrio nigripulchritudo TaxID=28173 RepID=UPI00190B6C12|nr:UDP-N-acetylglucosamine 2-epimerase [Vibrio nigripulchritudo]BCL71467.1 UDP-N-acetyl glucosamine 2-epimerase [Vibrio nigripulchritudo]BDU32824.1 UDP-N-acetyl glucosamine 2-epimerase [Vibrio nigripulchritudo]
MKKICVFTGTRAEYGLLYWLMKDIDVHPKLELQTLVSGSHCSPEFGLTFQKIVEDGFHIDEKVEMLLSSDSTVGVAKSMGLAVLGYSDSLNRLKPDLLVILGDRYEALAVAQTAMIMKIPIAHISGGEVTEGAYDDSIRHAITKMSHLHFTSNEEYRNRVIQLGEMPSSVYNFGSVGLEHLKRTEIYNEAEFSQSIGFPIESGKFFLVTYHPVTLDSSETPEKTFEAILKALDSFPNYKAIITYPNADDGGRKLIPIIEAYTANNSERVFSIKSLGQKRYYSAVNHCAAVIGNSSSGISEVPSFKKPTINIGSRQRGRVQADSIINCSPTIPSISEAIRTCLSHKFSKSLDAVLNPYGDGNTSADIIDVLVKSSVTDMKKFYDLPEFKS